MSVLRTSDPLSRSWWTFTLRGLLALAFACVAWMAPRAALTLLVLLFGGYALADGILAIVSSARASQRHERSWALGLEGALGVAVGVAILTSPVAPTAAAIVTVLLAAWALVTGVLELVTSARLRRVIRGEWALALSGLTRIAFGVVLLARRQAGLRALLWVMALYAVIYGVALLTLSFRLKSFHAGARPDRLSPQPA